MTTKRGMIADALKDAFKQISQDNGFETNLYENVEKRFIFPDEDPEMPILTFVMGTESINHQPGNFQDRYITVTVRAFVEGNDNSQDKTEKIIKDIETVVENNSRLLLADGSTIRDLKVTLIDTDQGVLAPLGLAEIQLVVEY
tara:strand:+ start:11 stop:439 length:429 start_codon:yes stop_codon:yes gene_type:complete